MKLKNMLSQLLSKIEFTRTVTTQPPWEDTKVIFAEKVIKVSICRKPLTSFMLSD